MSSLKSYFKKNLIKDIYINYICSVTPSLNFTDLPSIVLGGFPVNLGIFDPIENEPLIGRDDNLNKGCEVEAGPRIFCHIPCAESYLTRIIFRLVYH